jgi:hypothetical protein
MTFTPSPDNVLWLFSTAARLVLLGRLVRTGLFDVYRVLSVYLAGDVLLLIAYLCLPNNAAYFQMFVISQPIVWVLQASVLVELCFLIFRNHPGLTRTGKWMIASGLAMAFLISGITAMSSAAPIADRTDPYKVLFYYTAIERTLDIGMVLFLLVMTLFLCWYPIGLSRNVFVYFASWSFSFVAKSVAIAVPFASGHRVTRGVSLALQVIDLLCVIVWLALINEEGEKIGFGGLPRALN